MVPEKMIVIVTKKGKIVKFSEHEVRESHRDVNGVMAVRLQDGDEVVSVSVL